MSRKHRGRVKGDPVTQQTPLPAGGVQLETFVPWTLVKRGYKKQVITPLDAPQEFLKEAAHERQMRTAAQDTPLMRALGLAYHWQRLLDEGRLPPSPKLRWQRALTEGRKQNRPVGLDRARYCRRLCDRKCQRHYAATIDPQSRSGGVGHSEGAVRKH